jgi:hypothetical protein
MRQSFIMKSFVIILLLIQARVFAQSKPIRLSAWYWLNSAPKSEWEGDFRAARDIGFTDMTLAWGLAADGVASREADTKYALQACHRAGLGAYLNIWHPEANSLPRRPEFQQVDVAGHLRFAFDAFNPTWRQTQWKAYLQKVASAYGPEPAMAGYVFDDSFEVAPIDQFEGKSGPPDEQIISYGKEERSRFGRELPRKPSDPGWADWVKARGGWWEEWARDTVQFIRQADPNPKHIIYLEDGDYVLRGEVRDRTGTDLARVAKHMDAFCAYTAATWDNSPDSGARVAEHTRDVIKRTRAVVGAGKLSIYSFWVGNNGPDLYKPGHATLPTVEQIRQICDVALKQGLRHLDMYGWRIGDYRVSAEEWPKVRPGPGPTYTVTKPFDGKYLYDRPELHAGLRAYFHSITSGGSPPPAKKP